MQTSAYDLRTFYTNKIGRIVRRIIRQRILEFWPDMNGLRLMGYGYATPYLRMYGPSAERVFSVMPALQNAHRWPQEEEAKNLVCLSEETELPIETESVDRILMIHALEHAELMPENLKEIWRVLKSNGKVLFVVPNRAGLWAHAEWSPLGQGTPFSVSQLNRYLRQNMFVHERREEALFMPPVKSSFLIKSAGAFEYLGQTLLPFAAGVHMVEASKQIYANAGRGGGSGVRVRRRVFLGGKAVSMPRTQRE